MQPGDTIKPNSDTEQPPIEPQQAVQDPGTQQSVASPQVTTQDLNVPEEVKDNTSNPERADVAVSPEVQEKLPEEDENQQPAWQFSGSEGDANSGTNILPTESTISWTASEYISHDKTSGWYLFAVLGILVMAGLIYLITRELLSSVVVGVLGVAFVFFAARSPNVLEYNIDPAGVRVGDKKYPYGMFRSFSVLHEGALHSILLMPLQRFRMPITIYYDPEEEDRVVNSLGGYLPHEDRNPSPIDGLMRKIRF